MPQQNSFWSTTSPTVVAASVSSLTGTSVTQDCQNGFKMSQAHPVPSVNACGATYSCTCIVLSWAVWLSGLTCIAQAVNDKLVFWRRVQALILNRMYELNYSHLSSYVSWQSYFNGLSNVMNTADLPWLWRVMCAMVICWWHATFAITWSERLTERRANYGPVVLV